MVVRVEIVWLIFGSNLFCICKEWKKSEFNLSLVEGVLYVGLESK